MRNNFHVKPGMSPGEIVNAVRSLQGVCLTSVGMRDAGQSDFKNRHRIYDLKTLAPYYENMGLFSAECHGGARWHVGIMNRRESPFGEISILRELMPNVLLQTLIRETNLFGYRHYPKNIIEHVVSRVDIDVWREGLKKPGDRVDFELWGKPYSIELVSIGAEHDGIIHVVMRVNNKTRVYSVETPRAKKVEIRMAKGPNDIGAPMNGNVWRIGNPARGALRTGDIVHEGEEVANLEAMKMENAILAPFEGQIVEVCIKLNDTVQEGQLLFVIEKV